VLDRLSTKLPVIVLVTTAEELSLIDLLAEPRLEDVFDDDEERDPVLDPAVLPLLPADRLPVLDTGLLRVLVGDAVVLLEADTERDTEELAVEDLLLVPDPVPDQEFLTDLVPGADLVLQADAEEVLEGGPDFVKLLDPLEVLDWELDLDNDADADDVRLLVTDPVPVREPKLLLENSAELVVVLLSPLEEDVKGVAVLVFDWDTDLVAGFVAGTLLVHREDLLAGHVGGTLFVAVVVRVDVLDMVGLKLGTTPATSKFLASTPISTVPLDSLDSLVPWYPWDPLVPWDPWSTCLLTDANKNSKMCDRRILAFYSLYVIII